MTETEPQQSQIVQESSNNDEDMSAVRTTITQGGRIKWTEKMCIDLILCKEKAEELHQSENCPRKENRRKEGKMNLTYHFWNSMGYSYLKRTAQNLRDKLAHINKTTQVSTEQIAEEIERQRQMREDLSTEYQANPDPNTTNSHSDQYANHQPEENVNNFDPNDEEYKTLLKKAQEIDNEISRSPGDWQCRKDHTFVRKLPSKDQSHKLQNIAKNLINANPTENPEVFLWEFNCAIYATVTSFKCCKEENKRTSQPKKQSEKPTWLINMENKMMVQRKHISQITEEIRRIQKNQKVTKIKS